MTRLQAYLFAGGLSALITLPFAFGIARLFGYPLAIAYAFSFSAGCTWLAIWNWRRKGHRFSDDAR